MKFFFIITLFIAFILAATNAFDATSSPSGENHFTFGISSVNFAGLNKNDTSAAIKAWTKAIINEEKFNLVLHFQLYDDFSELKVKYENNLIDALSINVGEFIQLADKPDSIYIPSYYSGVFLQYAVVVRKDAGIETVSQLIGKTISLYDHPRMIYSLPWLKLELYKELSGQLPASTIASSDQNIKDANNASKAVFQVFFKQADAALITLETFNLAGELNPQLNKDLKVLIVSPDLITSMFLLSPNFQAD